MPASRALQFIDPQRIEAVLTAFVSDVDDRAFLRRCVVEEGPIHHRGANYVLIALLAKALAHRAPAQPAGPSPTVPVAMRLPPHLADDIGDGDYPLPMATAALAELAGGDAARLEAMIDCLTDGPAQHALANVLMVNLLDRLLAPAAR